MKSTCKAESCHNLLSRFMRLIPDLSGFVDQAAYQ
jgi:hypothetical protein